MFNETCFQANVFKTHMLNSQDKLRKKHSSRKSDFFKILFWTVNFAAVVSVW